MSKVVVVLGMLCIGCAGDAVLEVYIALPAAPAGAPRYAFVQALRSDTQQFDLDWLAAPEDPDGRALEAEPSVDHVSVVAAAHERDLQLRVRFCEDPRCGSSTDLLFVSTPSSCWQVGRPFYAGVSTSVHLEVAEVPPGPCGAVITVVDRCRVEGCSVTEPADGLYCDAGRHRCE